MLVGDSDGSSRSVVISVDAVSLMMSKVISESVGGSVSSSGTEDVLE